LHPLVDRPLASLAASFRGDSRFAKDSIKKGDKGLDGGIVRGGMKSQAMGAVNKVSITRANEGVSGGLGDGGTGGAVGNVAFPLCRR
jgi:hypothetical protein